MNGRYMGGAAGSNRLVKVVLPPSDRWLGTGGGSGLVSWSAGGIPPGGWVSPPVVVVWASALSATEEEKQNFNLDLEENVLFLNDCNS